MCNLCKIDADNMVLCPSCFERLSNEGALASAQTTFTNYGGIARLCLLGAFCTGFFLAPVALIYAIKGIKQKREMGEWDGVSGLYITVVLAGLECLGAILVVIAIVGAIAKNVH